MCPLSPCVLQDHVRHSTQGGPAGVFFFLISHQSLLFYSFGSIKQFLNFKGFCRSQEGAVDNRDGEPDS